MYHYGITITPIARSAIATTQKQTLELLLKEIETLGYGSFEWTSVGIEVKQQNGALHCHAILHCHKKPWFPKIYKLGKGYQIHIQILVNEIDQITFRNYCIKEHSPFEWDDYPPDCTKMPGWGLKDCPFPLQKHYIQSKHLFIKEPSNDGTTSTPV
ncbi:MAG: replicase [Cressdnaviricota sp.]|nr:MAG: replicase [Cressdnaviricota sp.]